MQSGTRRTIQSLILVAAVGAALAGCEFMVGTEERIARAEQALDKGDSGAAIVDLKNVLEKEPENARARLLLARAELLRGDIEAAAADLEKVNAADVVPAEEYEPLRWRLAYARRQYDEIVQALSVPRAGLSDGERLLYLGLAHAGAGRSAEAREALTKAVAARPEDGEALAALALATAASGDAAAAREMLTAGVRRLPNDERVQRALGDLEFRAGCLPEAEAAYRRAVELGSPRSRPVEYLGSASGLADVLLAQSKVDDASALAEQLSKNVPDAGVTVLLNARLAAVKRDYGTALENLQKLLNANPESAQLRTMVAGIQLEQGALEQASANLRRVLAAHPDAEQARRLLARVQLAQGRPKEADETLAQGGGGADLALMRARAALASGDTKRAIATLDELAAQGVPTEDARLDLAGAYIQAGRADRALEILDAAKGGANAGSRREQLRLVALAGKDRPAAIRGLGDYADRNAGDARAVTFAALTLAALGEFDAARARLGKLAETAPKDADVRVNLARVEARAGRLGAAEAVLREAAKLRPDAPTYVGLAQLAAARGREEEAIRLLEQARGADAKATQPRLLLARAYLAKGQLEAAKKVSDELLAIEPNSPQPHLLAATLAVRAKDTERALREANEAVRLAPEVPIVVLAKGEIHEQLGQRAEARAAYRRAASLAPNSAAPAAALARLEIAAGNAEAALAAARRVQQDPTTRAIGLQLEGDVLMQLRRPADAARAYEALQKSQPSAAAAVALYRARLAAKAAAPEESLRTWLESHPTDRAVRLALAEHWQRAGDRARAIAEYEAAVKAKSDDAIALNNLAWLYHETGDARALATAQRAHQLAPRAAAIADTLGVILVATGRVDEGITVLREAASSAPGFAEVQYHLAEALSRKGSNAEAQQILDGILRDAKAPGDVRTKAEALAKTLR